MFDRSNPTEEEKEQLEQGLNPDWVFAEYDIEFGNLNEINIGPDPVKQELKDKIKE